MKNKFMAGLLAVVLTTSILFTGCGNNSTENTNTVVSETTATETTTVETTTETETTAVETTADSDETAYPITITHAYGETVIESKPERIVTLGWENQDTPLALGVAPVGCSASNYGLATEHNLHPWTDEAFAKLGVTDPVVFDDVDGFDYEAIADAMPDVILCAYSGMTEEEYNKLSEIAPVVPFTDGAWQTTWRDQTILNATGMGMKEEGEALVAETDELISEKLAEYPQLAGVNAAFFWVDASDMSVFYAYLPTDPRASFLLDLGLSFPESISNIEHADSDFSITISHEMANQLSDVDIMIVYGDESLLEAMQADSLMSTIPAVKNGAVVLIDANTEMAAATTPSILSIPACIDEYLSMLNEAYEKIQ